MEVRGAGDRTPWRFGERETGPRGGSGSRRQDPVEVRGAGDRTPWRFGEQETGTCEVWGPAEALPGV